MGPLVLQQKSYATVYHLAYWMQAVTSKKVQYHSCVDQISNIKRFPHKVCRLTNKKTRMFLKLWKLIYSPMSVLSP